MLTTHIILHTCFLRQPSDVLAILCAVLFISICAMLRNEACQVLDITLWHEYLTVQQSLEAVA